MDSGSTGESGLTDYVETDCQGRSGRGKCYRRAESERDDFERDGCVNVAQQWLWVEVVVSYVP